MKIDHVPSLEVALVSVVTLENAVERELSDDQLLRISANLQGLNYDHKRDTYTLAGLDFGPPANGKVERDGDRVTVRTVV